MSEYAPHLEKRLLPLLDVTLVLVGILILLVGLSNVPPGDTPRTLIIEVQRDGTIFYEDMVIADINHRIIPSSYEYLVLTLRTEDPAPIVMVSYPAPLPDQSSTIDASLVTELQQRLTEDGFSIALTARSNGDTP
jgi:hypothetical protein